MPFSRKPSARTRTIAARARALTALRSRIPRAIRSPFSSVSRAVSFYDPPPWSNTRFREQKFSLIKNVSIGSLTSTTTVPVYGLFLFTISQIGDISSLGGVFDQYKIDWVELLTVPDVTPSTVSSAGQLVSVVDYDDAANPGSLQALLDYNNAIQTTGNFQHYHKFRPRIASAAYGGTVFSSFMNVASSWIDMASTNVEHYGVKMGWSATPSGVQIQQVYARLHVSFRSTR